MKKSNWIKKLIVSATITSTILGWTLSFASPLAPSLIAAAASDTSQSSSLTIAFNGRTGHRYLVKGVTESGQEMECAIVGATNYSTDFVGMVAGDFYLSVHRHETDIISCTVPNPEFLILTVQDLGRR